MCQVHSFVAVVEVHLQYTHALDFKQNTLKSLTT